MATYFLCGNCADVAAKLDLPPVDTGLVDPDGFTIWRLPDPEPPRRVGFQWD